MKIIVTNPPWQGPRAGSRWPHHWKSASSYVPYPMTLAGGVSALRAMGHDVTFLDAVALRMRLCDLDDFYARVRAIQPDLIIQEVSTPSLPDDEPIAQALSSIAPVAACGPHPTALPQQLLDAWPFLHAVLQGEIERNAVDLAETMRKGIYGFDYAKNLDDYPDMAQENLYLYRDVMGPNGGVTYQTLASRGCAWRCLHCTDPWQYTGRPTIRQRSPQRVVAECQRAFEKFPHLDGVYLDGPTENPSDRRARELADAFGAAGIKWGAMCRFDTLELETWDYMIDRGFYYVKGGVESANQQLVDSTLKMLKIDKVREAVRHLKTRLPARNIHMTIMYGVPGENYETVKESLAFCKELGVHWQESYLAPVPGSGYFKDAEAANIYPVEKLAMAGQLAPGNPDVAEWVKEAKRELEIVK